MKSTVIVSIYHDTRRPKQNNLFPVKLRVFSTDLRSARFYPTKYDLSVTDFQAIWETTKPRSAHKEIKMGLQQLEAQAYETANALTPFSFDAFRRKIYGAKGDIENLLFRYDQLISSLQVNGRMGSAESYASARRSLADYSGKERILFHEITPEWLEKYEKYMTHTRKRSRTTVGIYLRTLRAIFNSAIAEGDCNKDVYPFGRRKYQIPAGKNTKKALDSPDLKKLFEVTPPTEEQKRARDFWFFSYACNGMNIKDIALLKYDHIEKDRFYFYRAKTLNTKKEEGKPIQVHLTDFAKKVIQKWGNRDTTGYVFPIIIEDLSDAEKHRRIRNFTRSINQAIKKVAKSVGITADISTYYARHSFSTNIIRQGGRLEHVTEALGHTDTKTTMNYFKGFEDDSIKERAEKLMQF